MVKPIKAIEATHVRDDYAEIEEEVPYKGNIVPTIEEHLGRKIKIGRSSQIDGILFGKIVEIQDGLKSDQPTTVISIYGDEQAYVRDFCRVGGNVQSNGLINIGKNCIILGDVIGNEIEKIDDNTRIGGNVISMENIIIGDNVEIGGYVISLNGSVAIGNNSKVFDIISKNDIALGDNVTIIDSVIWCQNGKINMYKIKIGTDFEVDKDHSEIVKQNEINPYYISSNTFDLNIMYKKLNESLQILENENYATNMNPVKGDHKKNINEEENLSWDDD